MFDFSIDLDPEAFILAAQFAHLGDEFTDFKEPLTDSVRGVMMPSIKLNFQSGGRPGWAPLSDGTLRQRDAGRILNRSGQLEREATSFQIWTIDSEAARVDGLGHAWYGEVHQAGSDSRNIPSRPFLVVQPEDVDNIQDVFERWMERKLIAHGFTN